MSGRWERLLMLGMLGAVTAAGGRELSAAPLLTGAALGPAGQDTDEARRRAEQEARADRAKRARARSEEARERARSPNRRGEWVDAAEGSIVRTFKGGDGITLDLINAYGDIIVLGGKGSDGKLQATRRIIADTDADRASHALQVDVTQHGNRVSVRTASPQSKRVRVDYRIALPAGTALDLKNLYGDVRLTDLGGDVRVEAVAGDVVGEALTQARMLRSMSGDVTLSRSTVKGDANLQTVSGDVVASGVQAGSLTLGSVSGAVRVRNSSSERAMVRTVSGDIEFAAMPRKAGRYELKTHAGDILVLTTGGRGFEFEANTVRGVVTTDLPRGEHAADRRQVRGTVGDGSAFFDLTTFTGDIKLTRQ